MPTILWMKIRRMRSTGVTLAPSMPTTKPTWISSAFRRCLIYMTSTGLCAPGSTSIPREICLRGSGTHGRSPRFYRRRRVGHLRRPRPEISDWQQRARQQLLRSLRFHFLQSRKRRPPLAHPPRHHRSPCQSSRAHRDWLRPRSRPPPLPRHQFRHRRRRPPGIPHRRTRNGLTFRIPGGAGLQPDSSPLPSCVCNQLLGSLGVFTLWYNLHLNLTQEISKKCPRRLPPSAPARSSIRAAIPLSRPTFMSEMAPEAAPLFPLALPPASMKPSSCATETSQNISARAC